MFVVFCNYLKYLLSESLRLASSLRLYLHVSAIHNNHLNIPISIMLKEIGKVHVKQHCGTLHNHCYGNATVHSIGIVDPHISPLTINQKKK